MMRVVLFTVCLLLHATKVWAVPAPASPEVYGSIVLPEPVTVKRHTVHVNFSTPGGSVRQWLGRNLTAYQFAGVLTEKLIITAAEDSVIERAWVVCEEGSIRVNGEKVKVGKRQITDQELDGLWAIKNQLSADGTTVERHPSRSTHTVIQADIPLRAGDNEVEISYPIISGGDIIERPYISFYNLPKETPGYDIEISMVPPVKRNLHVVCNQGQTRLKVVKKDGSSPATWHFSYDSAAEGEGMTLIDIAVTPYP